MSASLLVRITAAVLVRPRLWVTALRQAHRLAPRGWWRRPPFLPLPDRGYSAFRQVTQYGDPGHPPEVGDILVWLDWCRSLPAAVAAGTCEEGAWGDQ
ncbi:MAG: hypothetical protein H8E59_03420 [Actinobacteria bacterium]|nr:hypothetical protein [Actinomycetota bacterium]